MFFENIYQLSPYFIMILKSSSLVLRERNWGSREMKSYLLASPQGSVLKPLLFGVYTNNFPEACWYPNVCRWHLIYVQAMTKQQAASKLTAKSHMSNSWKVVYMFFADWKSQDWHSCCWWKVEIWLQKSCLSVKAATLCFHEWSRPTCPTAARGDCVTPVRRSAFGPSPFPVRAARSTLHQ